jgi:hypothetical protein
MYDGRIVLKGGVRVLRVMRADPLGSEFIDALGGLAEP